MSQAHFQNKHSLHTLGLRDVAETTVHFVLVANIASIASRDRRVHKTSNCPITICIGMHAVFRHPSALTVKIGTVFRESVEDTDGRWHVGGVRNLLHLLRQIVYYVCIHAVHVRIVVLLLLM